MRNIALGFAAALTALLSPLVARAVLLNDGGIGQALIYPYYTVQTVGGNPQDTFVSIVNHTADAKAVRLRFREGRNGRPVAEVNLYLSPNDTWTGAVVPTDLGASLISVDTSCARPQVGTGDFALLFNNGSFTGAAADGFGDDAGRLREGFFEAIEMATLVGGSAAGVTHTGNQVPADCTVVDNPNIAVGAPSGGLSGTLTLINVANGLDFSVNAIALANLSMQPFYRQVSSSYPDFNAVEVNPVSVVVSGNIVYRSGWTRGVDAVSAVLMRSRYMTEEVVDTATHSSTDVVVTYPTRSFYASGTTFTSPFSTHCATQFSNGDIAGEQTAVVQYDREEAITGPTANDINPIPPPYPNYRCAAASVSDVIDRSVTPETPETAVFGSINRGFPAGPITDTNGNASGWISFTPNSFNARMQSLASSDSIDLSTGTVTHGAHLYTGVPVVGFSARTFLNGLLTCGNVNCQGNYGSAFPFKTQKTVGPAP